MSQSFVPVQVIVKDKAYTYKLPTAQPFSLGVDARFDLQPTDRVVVPWGAVFTVGIVESVNQVPFDPNAKFSYKWAVSRINFTQYEQLLANA